MKKVRTRIRLGAIMLAAVTLLFMGSTHIAAAAELGAEYGNVTQQGKIASESTAPGSNPAALTDNPAKAGDRTEDGGEDLGGSDGLTGDKVQSGNDGLTGDGN